MEPDALSSGGGLASYGHALRRRWPVALLLGLVCGGLAAASCWLWLPRTYTATAIIRIASSEMPLVFETADRAGQRQFDVYKRTQRQLVTNRDVLAKALNSDISELPLLQTQADPVTWLASQLKVSFPDDAEMMHVQLSADRPSDLAEVVNAVVNTYLDDVVGRERLQRLARFSTLEKLHAEKNLQLRGKYNELRQFTDAMGGDPAEPLSLEQQNALQQLGTIRSGLSDLAFELRQKEAELNLLQESAEDEPLPISDLQIAQALASDTVGAQLMLRRDSLTRGMQETGQRMVARKAEPLLAELKRELDSIEEQLEARRKALRDELSEARKAALRQQNASLEKQLHARISVLTNHQTELQTEHDELLSTLEQAEQPSVDVAMMRSEIAELESILGQIADELHRTSVELRPENAEIAAPGRSSDERIWFISPAETPRAADAKTRAMRAGGGGVAAFFLPFLLLIWQDARKQRINTPADVAGILRLSVLGSLPLVPTKVMRRLGESSKRSQFWRNLLSESVDSVAAVLLNTAGDQKRVILVSSAAAGEGKTTLAGHLAISLAAGAGRRTLLIDFDLRRPALHRIFGLEAQPGISEVLRGDLALEEAVQETQIPHLQLIAAGQARQGGLGLLKPSALEDLFARLRSEFEFIIVDGCPILPVVDTRLVGKHADAVILSVLRDVSRAPKVLAACEVLDSFQIPLLGVVVTGTSSEIYRELYADKYLQAQPA